ncbi:MAG: Na+/proline symporter [Planctomycetota bacterium]|jgi:Na+/proline symporter
METGASLRHPASMPIPSLAPSLATADVQLAGAFTWIDWLVVALFLAFTTWVGHRKSGKQESIRDFFLGGKKLPWYAVSASIIATEISALTFISLPSVVFKDAGNFTYLQLGLVGALVARCVVAFVLIPAYYEREIYSPYDYMANRLGDRARTTVTVLFAIGGVLGQAARVYLTALVLMILLGPQLEQFEVWTNIPPLVTSVLAIGTVAVGWTWMGGIAAVVWTDTILFLVFLIGICIAIGTVASRIDGGVVEIARQGFEAGKFRLWDFEMDWSKHYTFWAALFGCSWWMAGMYGTDQMMAQRFFCCEGPKEAKKAVLAAYGSMFVTLLVGFIGVSLYVWYEAHPMTGGAAELYAEKNDHLMSIFVIEQIPMGLKGLVMAGVFAAAISSLDSIMAALSQTLLSATWLPRRKRQIAALAEQGIAIDEAEETRHTLRLSRWMVLGWAVILCVVAICMEWVDSHYRSVLDLGLSMATYTAGGLLAGFALAFCRLPITGRGYAYSAPLSVLVVFSISWHNPYARAAVAIGGVLLVYFYLLGAIQRMQTSVAPRMRIIAQVLLLFVGVQAGIYLSAHGVWMEGGETKVLSFLWYPLIGSLVAFFFGWALADPAPRGGPAGAEK